MNETHRTMIWDDPDLIEQAEAAEELARWERYLDELIGKPSLTEHDRQWLRGLQTDILYSRMDE